MGPYASTPYDYGTDDIYFEVVHHMSVSLTIFWAMAEWDWVLSPRCSLHLAQFVTVSAVHGYLANHPTTWLITLYVLMILYIGNLGRAPLGWPATGPGGAGCVPMNICGLGGLSACVSHRWLALLAEVPPFHPIWSFPRAPRIPY